MDYRTSVAVIIPSLNPDEKLLHLLDGLTAHGFAHILLINDGSREDCAHYFETAAQAYGCKVFVHGVNLGKGRALKDAFNLILTDFPQCIGAVTVDSDGQHTIEDTAACAKALVEHPDALVLGCRDFKTSNIPPRSRFGNVITRQAIRLLCGIRVTDTQTGLRGISKEFMKKLLTVKGERFEFELNMLIEAKSDDIPFFEVPISTIYIEENASSHFNPLLDSIRIYSVFLKFILSSLSSFVVDILLFSLLVAILHDIVPGVHIVIATVGARILSSLFNYVINKNNVFSQTTPSARMLVRYFTLCIVQMTLSTLLVTYGFHLTHWNETGIKVIVDAVLFLFSFQIQREWVFRPAKHSNRKVQKNAK